MSVMKTLLSRSDEYPLKKIKSEMNAVRVNPAVSIRAGVISGAEGNNFVAAMTRIDMRTDNVSRRR
ncbi:MAG: hypothetical protein R2758_01605 [Bacteroidales bacterium]